MPPPPTNPKYLFDLQEDAAKKLCVLKKPVNSAEQT
jgi:hypothetical protein